MRDSARLIYLYLSIFVQNQYLMKCLLIVFTVLSLSSCRNNMDSYIERAMDDGMSRSEAKEMCEDGRDNSVRR